MSSRALLKFAPVAAIAVVAGLFTIPAAGRSFTPTSPKALEQLSQAPVIRYYLAHPGQAPAALRDRLRAVAGMKAKLAAGWAPPLSPPVNDRFNLDTVGLPQNEESVGMCKGATNWLIEGTNDYRGLLFGVDGTGWHYSNNGGVSVQNEGVLPPITLSGGESRPSGGDPVDQCVVTEGGPQFYAASLDYDPADPTGNTNGIGLYHSDPFTIESCAGGDDPSCWPNVVTAAESPADVFLDKPWMTIGNTGSGNYIWIVFTAFDFTPPDPGDPFNASLMAVRCDPSLVCGVPFALSEAEKDVQFGDVTIGADHRVYITWAEIQGELPPEGPITYIIHLRVGTPGCADESCFGPTRNVAIVTKPLPFGGFLQGNDFRIATVPKNIVKIVNGTPRVFVTWDECAYRLFDTVCETPSVKLSYSDNAGATWSTPKVLSAGGVNYFPTIGNDPTGGKFVVAWFTNRFDVTYQNAQDVEMVTMSASTVTVLKRQKVTTDPITPNETEADPILGGFFIGDYIEVDAKNGTAYVAYNMNIRKVTVFGEGVPVHQQDNYLTKVAE